MKALKLLTVYFATLSLFGAGLLNPAFSETVGIPSITADSETVGYCANAQVAIHLVAE